VDFDFGWDYRFCLDLDFIDFRSNGEMNSRIDQLERKNAELMAQIEQLNRVEKIFNDSPELDFEQCQELFPSEFAKHDAEVAARAVSDYKAEVKIRLNNNLASLLGGGMR
jgi:hypothetical protein